MDFCSCDNGSTGLKWGRTYEGYSEDSNIVSVMGGALIEGLQGTNKDFLSNNHILATAKHFIGDGGTFDGIDRGNTKLSEEKLNACMAFNISPH